MRKQQPPDTRLDWRDPNMPVLRNYRFADGSCRIEIDPDYERRYREHMLAAANQPDWRSDPSYNLRKLKKS